MAGVLREADLTPLQRQYGKFQIYACWFTQGHVYQERPKSLAFNSHGGVLRFGLCQDRNKSRRLFLVAEVIPLLD